MEFPKQRTINSPKKAEKTCFACKSQITGDFVEQHDPNYYGGGRKNYFHASCKRKFDIESIIYNAIKEAKGQCFVKQS